MKLSTAHTIRNNFPANIVISGDQHTMTKKWRARVFLTHNGQIHKLLVETMYIFDYQQRAVDHAALECEGIVNDRSLEDS